MVIDSSESAAREWRADLQQRAAEAARRRAARAAARRSAAQRRAHGLVERNAARLARARTRVTPVGPDG
ncbi:hypothetical protein OHA21_45550 [Actinoplanes sp. NBC_00393]|uniref:hypothetical protein n=1 Tax=Actinoplanes sp. NBC_00393 TaxID=2975953 RepID=UPI002E1F0F5B